MAAPLGERGRTALETLLVLILLAALLVVAVERYSSYVRPVKETALATELSNLRRAVNYFAMMNGRLPASLRELAEKNIEVMRRPAIAGAEYEIVVVGRYVEGMAADAAGNPLDPFGNPYVYDAATGRVRSGTRGYETW
jgi:Tfp pilus assembly protein PilE